MANEDTEKWNLPEALRITNPKVRMQAEQMAKDLQPKTISPFQHLSPTEFLKNRATGRIPHLMDDLNRVEEALKYERGRDSVRKLREANVAIRQKLAENFALVGRFDLAAAMASSPAQQKEYSDIQDAIMLDDSHKCECAPGKTYVKQYVYSSKHKRMMPIIACSGCGLMNATTLPVELAAQQAARAKAQSLVSGMKPAEAAQTLKAAGHTTEKLIPK